jgi:hypothetical protein
MCMRCSRELTLQLPRRMKLPRQIRADRGFEHSLLRGNSIARNSFFAESEVERKKTMQTKQYNQTTKKVTFEEYAVARSRNGWYNFIAGKAYAPANRAASTYLVAKPVVFRTVADPDGYGLFF